MNRERGFALVTVVLLMIGLAVLATGLLFAAAQHAAVTTTLIDLARARHGAEAAVSIALDEWRAPLRSLDPLGAATEVVTDAPLEPGLRIRASAQRIARGSFLVTGTAVVERGGLAPLERSAARVVRSLDADDLGARVDAALIAGRVSIASSAAVGPADAAAARDPAAAALCARWPSAEGAAVRAPPDSLTIADVAVLNGMPIVPDVDPLRVVEPLRSLAARLHGSARAVAADTITPAPVASALACDTAVASNWGAPDGPCAAVHVLRHADGALTIEGGYGQGVLLADGDVTLDGGAAFRGLIVASGTVTVREATIVGAIVASDIRLERGSVTLDRCAIAEAIALPAPLSAAHPPARSWLPTFD